MRFNFRQIATGLFLIFLVLAIRAEMSKAQHVGVPVGDNLLDLAIQFGFTLNGDRHDQEFTFKLWYYWTAEVLADAEILHENSIDTYPLEKINNEWFWVGPQTDSAVFNFVNTRYNEVFETSPLLEDKETRQIISPRGHNCPTSVEDPDGDCIVGIFDNCPARWGASADGCPPRHNR
jgi:hypothetical protein